MIRIIASLLFSFLAVVAFGQFDFQNFQKKDGLAGNDVYSMYQDGRGFVWIGTTDGLSRFDGIEFTTYRHVDGDTASICDNRVYRIVEDPSGYLWIGTANGLSRYDPVRNRFRSYLVETSGNQRPISVLSIVFDLKNDSLVWLSTTQGLMRLNPGSGATKIFIHDKNEPNSIGQTSTLSLFQDSTVLWVGLAGYGLDRFDTETLAFTHFSFKSEDKNFYFRQNVVRKISKDPSGQLLLATYGGLIQFNPTTGAYRVYSKQYGTGCTNTAWEVVPFSESESLVATYDEGAILVDTLGRCTPVVNTDSTRRIPSSIRTVLVDNQRNIWIGSGGNGIFMASPLLNRMESKTSIALKGRVNRVFRDSRGDYWIGVVDKGLVHFSSELDVIDRWEDERVIGNPSVLTIAEDREHNIWFGTDGGGLNKIDRVTGRVRNFRFTNERIHDHVDPSKTLMHDGVSCLYVDTDGMLWVGGAAGINVMDTKAETFVPYYEVDSLYFHLNLSVVRAISQLSSGQYLIGARGMYVYDREKQLVTAYRHSQSDTTSIGDNSVTSFLPDGTDVWVGTLSGMSLWDGERFKRYDDRHGLEDKVVNRVIRAGGRICVISEGGISVFDQEANRFTHFRESEGFSDLDSESGFGDGDRILGGGLNALYAFNPEKVWTNPYRPQVYLTRIVVLNEEWRGTQPAFLRELVLTHRQNIVTFEFASLNHIRADLNKYEYKLEGFDNDWRSADAKKRFATYTNLDAGQYVFRVRGSNNDGVWNEEGATLAVRVLPPPWATWWAYTGYGLVFVLALIQARRLVLQRERLGNQLKMEQFEKEKLRELDDFKSNLFANISHEFRTPLTLILGKSDEALKSVEVSSKTAESLVSIQRNGSSLLRLVTQMLDLSRIDAGKLVVQQWRFELVNYLKVRVGVFESLAQQKRIRIRSEFPDRERWVSLEPFMLEKIINNLISNAIKYSSRDSEINVLAREVDGCIELTVRDSGIGISKDHLPRVFDRFFRVSTNVEGTGIGLALTKELTYLMGGTIDVASEEGVGTEFRVVIPFGDGNENLPIFESQVVSGYVQQPLTIDLGQETASEGSPQLLLVEDNDELRAFIKDNLADQFEVIEANDGSEGWRKAEQFVPDVIVTDWMMPGLSGKELCEKVKGTEATSHIPVVLLTAKAGIESRIEGLGTGAIDYLTKPFEMSELKIRLRNLIRERDKLREKYAGAGSEEYRRVKVSSKDDVFIRKFYEQIDQRLDDSALTVEYLARELGVSRVQLHRKLRALTGFSASDLIRDYRLRRAADLLRQGAGNVSEVAYSVGFENLSYFTRAFKQKYNILPSEYPRS